MKNSLTKNIVKQQKKVGLTENKYNKMIGIKKHFIQHKPMSDRNKIIHQQIDDNNNNNRKKSRE